MSNPKSPIVDMPMSAPPVYVGPGMNPAVAAHFQSMEARRKSKQALPKYNEPVSGSPVSIPLLTGQHQENRTMAQQAVDVNSPSHHQQVQTALRQQPAGSIIQSGGGAPQARPVVQQLNLRPGDMLPAEAMRDPEYQQGPGSAMAMSQPGLASRYGVMRDGQRLMPQQLVANQPQVGQKVVARPNAIEDFQEFTRAQSAFIESSSKPADAPTEKEESEEPKKLSAEDEAQVKERLSQMDAFDFAQLRNQMIQDQLNHPNQRKIIEDRLKTIDIEELIMNNRVTQRVPIVPGKFEVTFLSSVGSDDLALKRLLMVESKSVEVTEQFLRDKFLMMSITLCVYQINNNIVPTHLDQGGDFNDDLFWTKFKWMMKRPIHMLSSIGYNGVWFESRVRKLFVAEKLGNG